MSRKDEAEAAIYFSTKVAALKAFGNVEAYLDGCARGSSVCKADLNTCNYEITDSHYTGE